MRPTHLIAGLLVGCAQAVTPTIGPIPTSPGTPTATQTASPTAVAGPTSPPFFPTPAADDAWVEMPPAPRPRAEFATAVVADRLYALGGFDAIARGEWLEEVDVLDGERRGWTSIAPLPEGRDHPAAAALDGMIYVFGGQSPGLRDDVLRYDPATDEWQQLAPMPARRAQAAAVAIADRIYVFGGVTPEGPGGAAVETWGYDPTADTWTSDLAPIPTRRNHLMAVELDGRAWVIGGRWDLNEATVESYDPITDEWQTEASLLVATSGATAAVFDDEIHVTGGEDLATFGTIDEHQVYDRLSGDWTSSAPLPTGRHGLGSGFVGGSWYVVGGGPAADYSASALVDAWIPAP